MGSPNPTELADVEIHTMLNDEQREKLSGFDEKFRTVIDEVSDINIKLQSSRNAGDSSDSSFLSEQVYAQFEKQRDSLIKGLLQE